MKNPNSPNGQTTDEDLSKPQTTDEAEWSEQGRGKAYGRLVLPVTFLLVLVFLGIMIIWGWKVFGSFIIALLGPW